MVFEKVRATLAAQFEMPPEDITADTDIMADLGADSLDVTELIMSLESEYGIMITDERIFACKTVGDIAQYIEKMV